MPEFPDGKKFKYTEEGLEKSREYAQETNQTPVRTYNVGGLLNRAPKSGHKSEAKNSRGGGIARGSSFKYYTVSGKK